MRPICEFLIFFLELKHFIIINATLSAAKIIENSLFEFFETKSKMSNLNVHERWVSERILENLIKYLVTKTSSNQKKVSLVSEYNAFVEIFLKVNFLTAFSFS